MWFWIITGNHACVQCNFTYEAGGIFRWPFLKCNIRPGKRHNEYDGFAQRRGNEWEQSDTTWISWSEEHAIFSPQTSISSSHVRVQGPAKKTVPRLWEFCSCCCLPLLPGLAWKILATWEPFFCRALYTNITIPIGCIVTQINVSLLSEDPTATATVVLLRDRSVLPFRRDYKWSRFRVSRFNLSVGRRLRFLT